MKTFSSKFLLLALVAALVYAVFLLRPDSAAALAMWRALGPARDFYSDHPVLAVLIFCLLHLLASTFSFPGGCTFLNVTSGAVFGFWTGCAVVYPVTLTGATLVYVVASRFSGSRWLQRYRLESSSIGRHMVEHDYFYLVSLRLSPLLPFGPLNLLLALMRVPFRLYFLTTMVGIFFDVTLLNNIGAGLGSSAVGTEKSLAVSFALLFSIFLGLRSYLPKAEAQ